MMTSVVKDEYKFSRFLYILEAAFEYFISILVAGAYLAKVAAAINLPDAITGILTSFVSLGCGFQIVAIFLANKRPVKRWVTFLHTLNQFAFAVIYLVPFFEVSKEAKIFIFMLLLLLGYAFHNVVNSPKINWFMSLVEDGKRGRFTACKEMVYLVGSTIFTLVMGGIIDGFEQAGNLNVAFIVCGVSIFTLATLHSLTLILSKEKPCEKVEKVSVRKMLSGVFEDKTFYKIIILLALFAITSYSSATFNYSYYIKELGFSMSFISATTAIGAVLQALCSLPLGKFADKRSFASMVNICYILTAVVFLLNVFTVPSNGKVLYTASIIVNSIRMAGITSATINLVYDYVDRKHRVIALAITNAVSGVVGFFATIAVSPLVTYIQNNGNTFLGIKVYAQQVTSMISVIFSIILILYLNLVVRKIKRKNSTNV